MKSFFPKAVLAGALSAMPFVSAADSSKAIQSSSFVSPAHVGQPGYSDDLSLLAASLNKRPSNAALPRFVPNRSAGAEVRRVELVKPADAANFRFDQRLSSPAPKSNSGQLPLPAFNQRYQFLFKPLD
jgi:hypothetical protein